MSLLATSYRFERDVYKSSARQRGEDLQLAKIKEDEENDKRAKEESREYRLDMMALWSGSLQESSENKRLRRQMKATGEELRCAGKALIKVRRAQLQSLLEEERLQQERELASLGKAFYIERL